ncbi:uncharacterized protein EV420DRAFT_1669391 [Desarmillaria tabescens]|uniref:PH domain-containing protein n=1 Tax=Armillaria tabescens TaxID=1929756 RepID=A0AA39T391_ARMTA|nr:uncharacterized protein EV420DRAFT_1669391 [Desarmillaria tabescens]KAK0461321.1 hypothetical protein EV420DRAFT_1669391 [Desarmillaria tabescens]
MMGPRTMDSRSRLPSLSRQKSTKQLINRYEAMAGSTTPAEPTVPTTLKKDRPSVRQSFRNLLGLFKKADGKMRLNNVFSARRSPSVSCRAESLVSRRSSFASTTPAPLSGPLLYLSRVSISTSNATTFPVWTTCTGTLEGDSISLSWLSPQGLQKTHSVSLKGCTDVRSLTAAQLEDEELILLPRNDGIDELRLFELVFGDKETKKFATTSVRERASWVSAVWDVVLSSQDISGRHMQKDATAGHDQDVPSEDHPLPPSPATRSLPALPDHDVLSPLSSALPDNSLNPSQAGHSISENDREPCDESSIRHSSGPKNGSKFQSIRVEAISAEKPLPDVVAQERIHRKSSVETESIFDAYYGGGHSIFQDESLHAAKAPTEPTDATFDNIRPLKDDLQQISSKLIGLRDNVDSGLASTRQRIQDINVCFGHTETLLKSLSNDLANMAAAGPSVPSVNSQIERLIQVVETLQRSLHTELSGVKESLDATRQNQRSSGPVTASQETPQPAAVDDSASAKAIQEKLEAILAVLNDKAELLGIQELLREEGNQRALQGQQQTDSVRYLNELNSWLESFVTNGASQIQAVHGAVEQIRHILGCDVEGDQDPGSLFKLMQDIRTCTNTLQTSIDNLAGFANSRNTFKLSNEIKGERLRFVDAMKEATEINVQTHVEEFKKELKREVHGMTQEIGRLYRERQTMENQIAELFAFYTKQKQGIPFAANAVHQAPFVQVPDPSQRRPLPSPQRYRPGY